MLADESVRIEATWPVGDGDDLTTAQQGFGDPSPAVTEGERFDKAPATIRQICKRHGDRVRKVVADDARFA